MALELPPYGFMNAENVLFLKRTPRPDPERFVLNGHTATTAEYEQWLKDLATEMSDFLWPIYTPGVGWQGSAVGTALDLTRADLRIMRNLQPHFDQVIKGGGELLAKHGDAWKREDDAPPGPSFDSYGHNQIPTLPQSQDSELAKAIFNGGRALAKPLSQRLKDQFQRPRPFQVALMLNEPKMILQASKSAITPSMISGHCIQGTMALAEVLDAFNTVLHPTLLDDLARFLLDTGDRRVFAGLHYPSDNLSSWFAAFRLCTPIYGGRAQAVRDLIWNAIKVHSKVYEAMKAEGSFYVQPLAKLEAAAGGG